MKILTKRLVLAGVAPLHAQSLWKYAVLNREHLRPWEPERPDEYFSLEYWERYVETVAFSQEAGTQAHFLFFSQDMPGGEILGQCRLSVVAREPFHAANLGYHLAEKSVGQGIMTEALEGVIRYAFEEMNLHRIQANYMPRNEASGRVLRRLGFVPEGYARDYLRIRGRWEDHILTSLTHANWRER